VSSSEADDALGYDDLKPVLVEDYKLIINTTPLGMYPNVDTAPLLPYESVGAHHLLFDLIYNPEETQFLLKGKAQGAVIKNGFEMLMLQAEASWRIWSAE
jgi:shikimate dehydrogenase